MKINLHKNFTLISFSLLILTSLISLTLRDILNFWFIIEINNFIFIYYLIISLKNKKIMLLFFIIQVLVSFCIILSILISILSTFNNFHLWYSSISFYSLILKTGRAPLHFWIPILMPHLNWLTITTLLTIQKIIPLVILTLIKPHSILYIICILLCMVIPPFMILNLSKFKKLLAYSSVNQIGWIILLILLNPKFWTTYFTFYSLSFTLITFLIKSHKIALTSWIKTPPSFKILFLIRIINISGIPPFSFFLAKWYRIFIILNLTTPNILIFILLFRALIITYIYINIITKISLHFKLNTKLLQVRPLLSPPLNILILFTLIFSSYIFLSI